MKSAAHIHLKSDLVQLQFEWHDFDGDDCFSDFHINVTTETGTRRFDFGGCGVYGLRQFSRFLRNEGQNTVSGEFGHPDIRYYDVYREKDGYRLVVRFEGSGLCEKFHIHTPRMPR